LRRHRLRELAGDSGARARPAGAHPGALRRIAPVDAARRPRRQEGTAVHDRCQSALHGRDPPMKDKLTPKVVAVVATLAVAAVAPQAAPAQSGYSAVPMDVVVTGRYLGVQRFLRHLRTQAGVAGPHVHATGRLFSVDSVGLAAGEKKLPQLAATIHLNAFTYD